MKVLVIGDIHGNFEEVFEELKNKEKDYDKVVFLGDYVDSFERRFHGKPMMDGFKKLCDMKDDKHIILFGNHDLAYLGDPNVSGHIWRYADAFKEMFLDNLDKVDVVCQLGDYVFSHAGVTTTWLEFWGFIGKKTYHMASVAKMEVEEFEKLSIIERVNLIFHKREFDFFDYNLIDRSGYGNNKIQGPVWIRPEALFYDMYFNKQIVGHTEQDDENCPIIVKEKNKELVIVDSPKHCNFYSLEA